MDLFSLVILLFHMNSWKSEIEMKKGEKKQSSQVLPNTYIVLFLCPSMWDGKLTLNKDNGTLKLGKFQLYSSK